VEVGRDRSDHVANLEACNQHDELEKPSEKAVLHVRGAGENQNDGETVSWKKNKTLKELPKNHTK